MEEQNLNFDFEEDGVTNGLQQKVCFKIKVFF